MPPPHRDTMHSLLYISSAREPFTTKQLNKLLVSICRKNEREKITGVLLYKSGNFMQLLEGSEDAVGRIFLSICNDSRHWAITVLQRSDSTERMFPRWSMAWRNLDDPGILTQPGFSQFMDPNISAREYFENPNRAQRLLAYFKETIG